MIKRDVLIAIFERMRDEKWTYKLGAAKEGLVDCSGAFVYAYKVLGGPSIAHGSNSIARLHVIDLLPASSAKPGMVAFKVRDWTEDEKDNRWYGTYPGDLYHVGLINGTGTGVLNAKGTKYGFVESKLDSSWAYAAYLKDVDYSENGGDSMVSQYGNAVVNTVSTGLRIREGASTSSAVLGTIPKGSRINVIRDTGIGWYYVEAAYPNLKGYVSSEYVLLDEDTDEPVDDNIPENSIKMEVLIEDSEGRTFYPIGDFKVTMVPYSDD